MWAYLIFTNMDNYLKCIGLYIFSLKIPDFLLILLFRVLHQNNSVEVGFAVRIGFSPTKPAPLLRALFYSMDPVMGREGRQYFSYMAEAALPAVNKQWKISKHCQDCCNSLTITTLRDLWLKASADLKSANCLRVGFFFGGGAEGREERTRLRRGTQFCINFSNSFGWIVGRVSEAWWKPSIKTRRQYTFLSELEGSD